MNKRMGLAMGLVVTLVTTVMMLVHGIPLTAHSQDVAPGIHFEESGGGGTLTIVGSTFVPENHNTVYQTSAGGGVAVTSGAAPADTRMHAPVHLPDGAQVSGITLYYYDAAVSDFLSAHLYRNNDAYVGAALPLAIVSSSGSSGYGNAYGTTGTPVTIDNQRYNYEIITSWSTATATLHLMAITVDFVGP